MVLKTRGKNYIELLLSFFFFKALNFQNQRLPKCQARLLVYKKIKLNIYTYSSKMFPFKR